MKLYTTELVKKYKSRTVVNQVSIDVKQGEIVGLLGPNGAGKTTTFYMIVGLVRPNSGKISFKNTDITEYPVYKDAALSQQATLSDVYSTLPSTNTRPLMLSS